MGSMTKENLLDAIQKFFGDTSRSADETKDGLEEAAELAEELANSIDV